MVPRCETEQAKGRHPYVVTGASVLRRSLHAHQSRDKRCRWQTVERWHSPGCCAEEDLTCGYSGCTDRPCACVTGGLPRRLAGVSFRASSDATQEKRRSGSPPKPFGEADPEGARQFRRACGASIDREGTVRTRVVPRSRVLSLCVGSTWVSTVTPARISVG